MSDLDSPYSSRHLSTVSLPIRDRLSMWREVFGQTMVRLDIEPRKGQSFNAEGTLCALPGAAFASVTTTPVRVSRTRRLIADDCVDMLFLITADATLHIAQGGKERKLDAGDALFLRGSECSIIQSEHSTRFINIAVPVDSLTSMHPACEDLSMTVVSRQNELLGFLLGYADLLRSRPEPCSDELGRIAAGHVRDLMAAMAGVKPYMLPLGERGGPGAARLAAIKVDIGAHLCEPSLSAIRIAASHGISSRYLRRLFQQEQTSFSDHVLGLRLEQACRLLHEPDHALRTIASIAYSCGFNDLSYFNRTFRRRFGMTPREWRTTI